MIIQSFTSMKNHNSLSIKKKFEALLRCLDLVPIADAK